LKVRDLSNWTGNSWSVLFEDGWYVVLEGLKALTILGWIRNNHSQQNYDHFSSVEKCKLLIKYYIFSLLEKW
jgi:hypothetical protein